MIFHQLVPLVAFALNLTLAMMVLYRDHRSALNRVFASVAAALGVWNLGVFFLRSTGDVATAVLVEKLLHFGVILVPAFYYHFVVVFLEIAARRRRLLAATYALAVIFLALSPTPLFMRGVVVTYWGFAPAFGPLYNVFFAWFMASIVGGIVELGLAYGKIDSAFRRNRAKLIILGSAVSLLGGVVDIARVGLKMESVYPVGIPANAVMAMLLGALAIYGIQPGPLLIKEHPQIFWGLIASMYVGNVMLLILNLPLIPLWVQVLKIPYGILYPVILLFCLIGSYSLNNNIGDVIIMWFFGVFGFLMKKFQFEPAPLVLALVLGPMLEDNLRQSLIISQGNFSIFISRPLSVAFLVVSASALLFPLLSLRPRLRETTE